MANYPQSKPNKHRLAASILEKTIKLQLWRSQIGVVAQEISLFNGNLLYNIALEEVTQEKALEIINFCKRVGIHQYFEQFHQGYFTILGDAGIHISGGQKQLLGLARALYRKPQLLLLDEATSAMDKNAKQFVMKLLENLKATTAIIFITHQQQIITQADSVYELENGILKRVNQMEETFSQAFPTLPLT